MLTVVIDVTVCKDSFQTDFLVEQFKWFDTWGISASNKEGSTDFFRSSTLPISKNLSIKCNFTTCLDKQNFRLNFSHIFVRYKLKITFVLEKLYIYIYIYI